MRKQSFHQRLDRQLLVLEETEQLLVLVRQIRVDHPRMSSRKMYRLIRPLHLGRDRFEAFCFENGFKVSVKRSYRRTTNSLGVTRFENLLIGVELIDVNQVWASDITYYQIGDCFFFLTFVLDLYSRMIVGYSVAFSLSTASTTIPALEMSLRTRKITEGLIFHSDGGGQYYCKTWLQLTSAHKIKNSMCETPYENAYAERINGIIKNDYLSGYGPTNYNELVAMTKKAVTKYNYEKPHGSLGYRSPYDFEQSLNGNRGNVDDLKTSNPHSPRLQQ
jgi:putative transposase